MVDLGFIQKVEVLDRLEEDEESSTLLDDEEWGIFSIREVMINSSYCGIEDSHVADDLDDHLSLSENVCVQHWLYLYEDWGFRLCRSWLDSRHSSL